MFRNIAVPHCNAILLRSSLGRNGRTQQQDTHTCAHTASMRVHAAAALSGFWAGTLQRTPLFLRQATSGAESAGAAEMRVNRASLTACAAASLVCPAAHTPTFFCTTEHSRWRCSARRTVRCAPLAVGRHAWPWWPTPPHPRSAGHDACVTVCGGQSRHPPPRTQRKGNVGFQWDPAKCVANQLLLLTATTLPQLLLAATRAPPSAHASARTNQHR